MKNRAVSKSALGKEELKARWQAVREKVEGKEKTEEEERKGEREVELRNASKKDAGKILSFVVQEHHATRLHWDFRLEMHGALRSWAVPKGPPTEEGVKRLAVETEEHALEYGGFEGEIPEGSYGAGRVLIWDKGTYEPESVHEDKIVFVLKGKKMQGRYCMIRMARMGPKNWLMFKMKERAD